MGEIPPSRGPTPASNADPDRIRGSLRNAYLSNLIMLGLQFLLGMAVNLFVNIPTDHPGSNPPEYFSGVVQSVTWAIIHGPSILLSLHAILGLLLVVGAFVLVVRAIRSRDRGMIVTATIGALAILAAGFNGGSFLNYNQDFSSMLMATFFAIAVIAYEVGLFLTARQRRAASSRVSGG